jgi:hypothetical protein
VTSQQGSLVRLVLLVAMILVVSAAALVAPLGQAASAPSEATNGTGEIETQGLIYRNTFVRCPRYKEGTTVWDGNGKGGYPAGRYTCFRAFKNAPKTWWYHDRGRLLPCVAPSTKADDVTEPRRISTNC